MNNLAEPMNELVLLLLQIHPRIRIYRMTLYTDVFHDIPFRFEGVFHVGCIPDDWNG